MRSSFASGKERGTAACISHVHCRAPLQKQSNPTRISARCRTMQRCSVKRQGRSGAKPYITADRIILASKFSLNVCLFVYQADSWSFGLFALQIKRQEGSRTYETLTLRSCRPCPSLPPSPEGTRGPSGMIMRQVYVSIVTDTWIKVPQNREDKLMLIFATKKDTSHE